MKSNFWLLGGLAGLAAASVWAQDAARDTNPPATISRSVTGPLAKDVVLNPPASATVRIESLIVRSQPAFAGELITHVAKGQSVTVLEQITLARPRPNEPTNWARITLPTNAAVWVFADYVDTNTMTISRARVNVRSGASDFHDIVARLDKGAPVKEVRRVTDWIQIEPPTNAYGFVGADYLTMQAPAAPPPAAVAAAEPAAAPVAAAPVAAAPATPEPVAPPATNTTSETASTPPAATAPVAAATATPEPVAPPATNTTPETTNTAPATAAPVAAAPATPEPAAPPATNTAPETTNTTLAAASPPPIVAPEPVATAPPPAPANSTPPAAAVPAAPAPAAAATPESAGIDPKPRIVTREGTVRKALNIQAPADYELRDINSGQLIEYLQPDAKEKNFKRFTGIRVSVTGPEWLDRRWPKTPILQIQTLDLMP
jgi:uncharacterized protein YgiM (DUF1202 family)